MFIIFKCIFSFIYWFKEILWPTIYKEFYLNFFLQFEVFILIFWRYPHIFIFPKNMRVWKLFGKLCQITASELLSKMNDNFVYQCIPVYFSFLEIASWPRWNVTDQKAKFVVPQVKLAGCMQLNKYDIKRFVEKSSFP